MSSTRNYRYFEVQERESVLLVTLRAFDWDWQIEIAGELGQLYANEQPLGLMIDLRAVFGGGYALLWNRLLVIHKSITAAGGKVAVCLSGDTWETANLLQLDGVLNVHKSVEDAWCELSG